MIQQWWCIAALRVAIGRALVLRHLHGSFQILLEMPLLCTLLSLEPLTLFCFLRLRIIPQLDTVSTTNGAITETTERT